MSTQAGSGHGYKLSPEELNAQVTALTKIADQTAELIASANQLAQRSPMLGSAPPAMHLSQRLQNAAGQSGLSGAVSTASSELADFHDALKQTVTSYLAREDDVAHSMRSAAHDDSGGGGGGGGDHGDGGRGGHGGHGGGSDQ